MKTTIYHGSNVEVSSPRILQNGFYEGRVSKAAFWELVKFRYPTHQIVFCTEEALKTITFKGSDTL